MDEDDEENELLNKSELLIGEDRQINNSPSSGGGLDGTRSTDLMTMMMLMNLNGTANGEAAAGGVSSSLATTALPTIYTPLYATDNENFVIPPTRAMMKKSKLPKGSKKNADIYLTNKQGATRTRKAKLKEKADGEADETNSQIEASILNKIEQIKQMEKSILEEKLEQQKLKQQQIRYKLRRKRQLQLQLQQQKQLSQSEIIQENMDANHDSQTANLGDQAQVRRRRRRRDYLAASVEQQELLSPEDIEKIKSKTKEQLRQRGNRSQTTGEAPLNLAGDEASLLTTRPSAETVETAAPRLPSSLQKRVSFILTASNDELKQLNSSNKSDENMNESAALITEQQQNTAEMAKRILKYQPASSASKNSLQAKVFSNQNVNEGKQAKPVILSSYKPPMKLDALGSGNEPVHALQRQKSSTNEFELIKENMASASNCSVHQPLLAKRNSTTPTPANPPKCNCFPLFFFFFLLEYIYWVEKNLGTTFLNF